MKFLITGGAGFIGSAVTLNVLPSIAKKVMAQTKTLCLFPSKIWMILEDANY